MENLGIWIADHWQWIVGIIGTTLVQIYLTLKKFWSIERDLEDMKKQHISLEANLKKELDRIEEISKDIQKEIKEDLKEIRSDIKQLLMREKI